MPAAQSDGSIHIAVACDERYAMPLAAMLFSLVAELEAERELTIHALLSGVPQETWRKLEASVSARRVTWNVISFNASTLIAEGYGTRRYEHISAVTFFRLLLPELLPPDLAKVLYLDSDLIVRQDISPLWRTDIRDVPLAAVRERNVQANHASSPGGIRLHRALDIDAQQPLFNAGVLLMNLSHWRHSHLAQRAFAYLRAAGTDVRWYEQEALNVVTEGHFRELELKWNVPAEMTAKLTRDEVAIVHYLTSRKPWHRGADPARAAPFFDALDRTAWAGWRPQRQRLEAVEQLRTRIAKAARKRWHAAHAIGEKAVLALTYRRACPEHCRLPRELWPPPADTREIRLFLPATRIDPVLLRTLTAHFGLGVQRAFVLIDHDPFEPIDIPERYGALVHVFARRGRPVEHALRRLVHRYGAGNWCVLGRLSESIVDESGSPVHFAKLCDELDRAGEEVVEGASGAGEPIALTARDLRSQRLFRGHARVAGGGASYTPPAYASRVVLVKYGRDVLLDAGAHLSGNAPRSARCLRLTLQEGPGGPSADRRVESQAPRS